MSGLHSCSPEYCGYYRNKKLPTPEINGFCTQNRQILTFATNSFIDSSIQLLNMMHFTKKIALNTAAACFLRTSVEQRAPVNKTMPTAVKEEEEGAGFNARTGLLFWCGVVTSHACAVGIRRKKGLWRKCLNLNRRCKWNDYSWPRCIVMLYLPLMHVISVSTRVTEKKSAAHFSLSSSQTRVHRLRVNWVRTILCSESLESPDKRKTRFMWWKHIFSRSTHPEM